MTWWQVLAGSIAAVTTAVVTGIVLLRKLGPEVNHIQVQSSQNLVSMAEAVATMQAASAATYRTDAEDMRVRNKDLDDRLTRYVAQLGEALQRISDLEANATHVDQLLASERREKAQLSAENDRLRVRVAALEAEVADLKNGGAPEAS